MEANTKKILITCAVIAVGAAVCIVVCVAGFIALFQFGETFSTAVDAPFEIIELGTTSDVPTEKPSTTVSDEVREQMAIIEAQMVELRGLEPNDGITRILYSPEQLRERVIDDFFSDYTPEEAATDATVLSLLGLLEPDTDILAIYIELYSEGIAGFYDDETGEMVVVQGSGFMGPEHITYAHEYIHALQDSTYDISDGLGFNDETCEEDSEFCLALQALLEGDASFSENRWYLDYATSQQQDEIIEFYSDYESPAFNSSPQYLQQDLLYPYIYGQQFVSYLYSLGGWGSVNNAFTTPPISTEQILHPERYPGDIPILVELPDFTSFLSSDWEIIDEDTLGEWYTLLLLGSGVDPSARLNEFRASNAAEGWGGDSYVVFQHSGSSENLLVLQQIWDSSSEAEEYVQGFLQYATARFGDPSIEESDRYFWDTGNYYVIFYFDGEETVWIISPEEDISLKLLDSILQP